MLLQGIFHVIQQFSICINIRDKEQLSLLLKNPPDLPTILVS